MSSFSDADRRLLTGIARELVSLGERVEDLGVTLATDPAIARAYGGLLQECDRIAQTAHALAGALPLGPNAGGSVTLDALRERLLAGEVSSPSNLAA